MRPLDVVSKPPPLQICPQLVGIDYSIVITRCQLPSSNFVQFFLFHSPYCITVWRLLKNDIKKKYKKTSSNGTPPFHRFKTFSVSQLPCCVAPLLDALRTVWQHPCVEEVDNPVTFRFLLGIVLGIALWTTTITGG